MDSNDIMNIIKNDNLLILKNNKGNFFCITISIEFLFLFNKII